MSKFIGFVIILMVLFIFSIFLWALLTVSSVVFDVLIQIFLIVVAIGLIYFILAMLTK